LFIFGFQRFSILLIRLLLIVSGRDCTAKPENNYDE